jgi:hypothetical protein
MYHFIHFILSRYMYLDRIKISSCKRLWNGLWSSLFASPFCIGLLNFQVKERSQQFGRGSLGTLIYPHFPVLWYFLLL